MRAAAALLLLCLLPGPAIAQEIRESDLFFADRSSLARLLEEARLAHQAGQLDLALERATSLLEAAAAARQGEQPLPAELEADALLLRARLRLARKERRAAVADLEQALRLRPASAAGPRERSAFAALLAETRGRMLGRLAVESDPPGATVLLEGTRLGRTPLASQPVLAGLRYLRLERPGFAAVEREIKVDPKRPVKLAVKLERTSATFLLLLDADEAQVKLDGQLQGVARRPSPEEALRLVDHYNLPVDSEDPPAVLLLSGAAPGLHQLEIEAPCRRPLRQEIEIPESKDATALLSLEPTRASLRIEGPLEMEVELDGKPRGRPPLLIDDLCPGLHDVVASWPGGMTLRRSARVSEAAETTLRLDERPVLALLAEDLELEAAIERDGGYHVLAAWGLSGARPDTLVDGAGRAQAAQRELLRAATSADLFAWRSGAGGERSLLILAADSPRAERIPAADAVQVAAAVRRLSADWETAVPDLGLLAIDTQFLGHPIVASLTSEGPALAAGIRLGDEILAVGDLPIATLAELRKATARLEPGAAVSIAVRRSSGELRAPVLPRGALLDPDFRSSVVPANAALARASRRLSSSQLDEAQRGVTAFARGKAFLALGAPALALTALSEAELPSAEGVEQGTLHYYRALAALESGQLEEVAAPLTRALGRPSARLLGPDGPPLAPLLEELRRRAAALASD